MGRKRSNFQTSAELNSRYYSMYLDRLTELAISMFEWVNLPDTIDSRYMELKLFQNGSVVYFNDDVIGNLCLDCIQQGAFDVYGRPIVRRAYSGYNNYNKVLDDSNSVIIWNNMLRTNSVNMVELYARRLAEIDAIIDVNVKAQKTPTLVQGTDKQRLSLINLYKEFEGNSPVIFGDKNLDLNSLKVLKTDAPYVADALYTLKTQIWNEALTYLGISNLNVQKKERLVSDEVMRNMGGTIASRYSRLESRRQACIEINKMFGTNIECNYRDDFRETDDEVMITGDTGDDTPKKVAVDLRTR